MPVPLFWQFLYQEGLLAYKVLAISIATTIVTAAFEQLAAIFTIKLHTSSSSTRPATNTIIIANINSVVAFASNCNTPYTDKD